jgi:hypothetical protein
MYLVLNLLDQALVITRWHELPHCRHVLVLFKRLGHLLHDLLHQLLGPQQPLALLGFGIGMQALPDRRHTLLQFAQRIKLNGRDLDVRRCVTGLHLQNVLKIANASLHRAALERALRTQLA